MLSQLVGLCLEIAMLIYEDKSTTGLGVNEISRRTSSRDKPRIIRAIRYLEGAALIETRTSPTHEQKKIKILTTLGYEFTQLIKSINDYMACYDKFEAKVRDYYDIHENIGYDILINKLRNKGYSQEESAS